MVKSESALGETIPPSWSASGRDGIDSLGTKEPLPMPLSIGAELPAEGG